MVNILDGTDYKTLLDTVASKSFMYSPFSLNCPSLNSLPRFVLSTRNSLVDNG